MVWQKAIELVVKVYQITKTFPQQERYALTSQIQRAVTSIPANIAEGWGRGSTKEYIHHLKISRGSLMELETHLIVAQRLQYILNLESLKLIQQEIEVIGKMLNKLIISLEKRI
ncbi:MAG: four helix bundle protein [Limnoraphis sp.]|nr:four helix bundle protein [Lyngbya sp. PCC 8106]